MNIEKVVEGDTFYIPTGSVHDIGACVLLAEIQQTSKMTYRIFDYDRVDKTTGEKRELHTDLALDAIDFNHYNEYATTYSQKRNATNTLINTPYFKTNYLDIAGALSRDLKPLNSFVIYICVEGFTEMQCKNQMSTLDKGETILFPATIEALKFKSSEVKLLEVYL